MSDKPQNGDKKLHWLVRPKTIKGLWIGGVLMLAAITALSMLAPHHESKFGWETTPAFFSWYGFLTCVAMVVFAKFVLGLVLTRKDTFYDD